MRLIFRYIEQHILLFFTAIFFLFFNSNPAFMEFLNIRKRAASSAAFQNIYDKKQRRARIFSRYGAAERRRGCA